MRMRCDAAAAPAFVDSGDVEVLTLSGTGEAGGLDGPADVATFNAPFGVASLRDGALCISEAFGHRLRIIAPAPGSSDGGAMVVSTLVGSGTAGFADGVGQEARFDSPMGMCSFYDGREECLLVADTSNHRIRRVSRATGRTTTLAGDGVKGCIDGPADAARLSSPTAVVAASDHVLYISDSGNHRVCALENDGRVRLLAGSGERSVRDGIGADAHLFNPAGVTCVTNIYLRFVAYFRDDTLTNRSVLLDATGLYLDEDEGLLYVATSIESHRVRTIAVPTRRQRRAKRLLPIVFAWALIQRPARPRLRRSLQLTSSKARDRSRLVDTVATGADESPRTQQALRMLMLCPIKDILAYVLSFV